MRQGEARRAADGDLEVGAGVTRHTRLATSGAGSNPTLSIQLGSRLLRESNRTVAAVALDVGYE